MLKVSKKIVNGPLLRASADTGMHKPESRDAVDQKFFVWRKFKYVAMTKKLQLDYILAVLIGFDMQTNRKCSTLSSVVFPEHYHILFFYNYNFCSFCSKRLNVPITKTSFPSSKRVHYIFRALEAFSENVSMERRTMLPKLEVKLFFFFSKLFKTFFCLFKTFRNFATVMFYYIIY